MKTVTVRPEFAALREFTTNLPKTFDHVGRVIYNGRNIIKKIDTHQGAFVVKNFKGMYFFNRLAYSLFRKSKAARSYLYSAFLNARGIPTPPHVAWIDCYSLGFLTRSYFVSVYDPNQTLGQAMRYYDIYEPSRKQTLLHDTAAFARKLHLQGIYHEDFSVGNILVIRKPGRHEFALIDLNRIQFQKKEIGYEKGLRNLVTLGGAPEEMNMLVSAYATLSGKTPERSIDLFWKFQKRKMFWRRLRKRIKRYTVTPFERIFREVHSA